jgi:hypothetical protein
VHRAEHGVGVDARARHVCRNAEPQPVINGGVVAANVDADERGVGIDREDHAGRELLTPGTKAPLGLDGRAKGAAVRHADVLQVRRKLPFPD